MRVSAKADYAVRAAAELAAASGVRPLKRDEISTAQKIPSKFLETIMLELKHAGIVKSTRGAGGGYALARPAAEISVADVIRAVDGPLANVRGERVETVEYTGSARALRDVWVAVRASLRRVLETTSLQDLVEDHLPESVRELTADPEAWISLNRRRRAPAGAADAEAGAAGAEAAAAGAEAGAAGAEAAAAGADADAAAENGV